MRVTGLIAALPLIAGAVAGTFWLPASAAIAWILPVICGAAVLAWWWRVWKTTVAVLAAGFLTAGAGLAADARERALHTPLRSLLEAAYGGFSMTSLGPEADHDPLPVTAVILEDAAVRDGFVSLRVRTTEAQIARVWHQTAGGVTLSISGEAAPAQAPAWRAGRRVEMSVTFRRPARYLNEGVSDFERDLALDGTTLFGSAKSGLLVAVVAHGTAIQEFAAAIRAHVRRAVSRWVSSHDDVAGAIVTAVLIGDRTGLPDHVRDRLQAAGTYHVIAISGGNIAILAALVVGLLMIVGIHGRTAALLTILALLAYSQIATAGPSVWRATLMAVVYLAARLLDHRTAPWQAAAVAAAAMVVAQPLDIRDPGFLLTFGATAALLEAARLGRSLLPRQRALAWATASIAASLAAEITLLPVSAQVFSRVTSAGLLLNLIAVPMMGLVQVAGIVVVLLDCIPLVASAAGWIAFAAATSLVESARLVEVVPGLSSRVPPPGVPLVVAYYVALLLAVYAPRRLRMVPVLGLIALLAVVGGVSPIQQSPPVAELRLTMFDVGQGEAMVLESRERRLQIDAGGAAFGGGSFDIGARVLAPALWARRIASLDALLVTHGDPDHIGGATTLVDEFAPRRLWEGIDVPRHVRSEELRARAAAVGARPEFLRAGESFEWGSARIRVLHPPAPDWERPRVRNDDSVVLEVVHGDVALLLTGDIGAEVERTIVPLLTPAATRILKVAHHGSRTSTSRQLLEAWRPQIALISAGRGNTFGHPAPDVISRLDAIGARIYRTDLHGQITVETDGGDVRVRTYVGGAP